MEQITLSAQRRELIGKQVGQLRRKGLVPAVVYGHRTEPMPLVLEEKALRQVMQRAGSNQLISLQVDDGGAPRMVLLREVQREPIKRRVLHVDLYEVIMTERIRTEIPIVLVGASPIVKRGDALLHHGIDAVEVECLPGDLIQNIEVDITPLAEIDQEIKVADLQLGDKFEILSDPDEVVARIIPIHEEVIEEVAPAAETEVEVVGRAKPEEEAEKEKPEEKPGEKAE